MDTLLINKYPHFQASEFARCKPACSISDMDEAFMNKVEQARIVADIPFIINSAYRTFGYEIEQGRSGNSSHCKGLALDIKCLNSWHRFTIVSALIKVGFSRIGIGKTFIHVDDDKEKNSCIWLY